MNTAYKVIARPKFGKMFSTWEGEIKKLVTRSINYKINQEFQDLKKESRSNQNQLLVLLNKNETTQINIMEKVRSLETVKQHISTELQPPISFEQNIKIGQEDLVTSMNQKFLDEEDKSKINLKQLLDVLNKNELTQTKVILKVDNLETIEQRILTKLQPLSSIKQNMKTEQEKTSKYIKEEFLKLEVENKTNRKILLDKTLLSIIPLNFHLIG
jgi:hypothetical protein